MAFTQPVSVVSAFADLWVTVCLLKIFNLQLDLQIIFLHVIFWNHHHWFNLSIVLIVYLSCSGSKFQSNHLRKSRMYLSRQRASQFRCWDKCLKDIWQPGLSLYIQNSNYHSDVGEGNSIQTVIICLFKNPDGVRRLSWNSLSALQCRLWLSCVWIHSH